MESLQPDRLSLLSTADLQKAGLPFWVFYLLLSLILLLIFINFLQKKDLRQKLSYFLAWPRRRFSRLRIQVLIKKEDNKKEELLKRLGEFTSIQWPDLPELEDLAREIKTLEENNTRLQAQWHRVYKELEARRAEKQKLLSSQESEEKLKARLAELDQEMAELEKSRAEIQASIVRTDELLEPYHKTIGSIMYRLRPEREDLAFLYFQLDSLEDRIRQLQQQLEKL
ncbi:MAG: hypothetical protein ACUVRL_03865 [Candidatus Saccharicenans sp.]|uniref:hypothetical protein n=1 Tax=Candidatus Saccharicenans sp. TaxID=2819258 RepID=UPI00404B938C